MVLPLRYLNRAPILSHTLHTHTPNTETPYRSLQGIATRTALHHSRDGRQVWEAYHHCSARTHSGGTHHEPPQRSMAQVVFTNHNRVRRIRDRLVGLWQCDLLRCRTYRAGSRSIDRDPSNFACSSRRVVVFAEVHAFTRAIGMTDSTAHIHRTSSSATPQSSRGNHGDEALESGGVLDKGSLS